MSAQRLAAAIRAFTVDAPNGKPNGPAEYAFGQLRRHLKKGDMSNARKAFEAFAEHSADQVRELRIAAEEHMGGDFGSEPS